MLVVRSRAVAKRLFPKSIHTRASEPDNGWGSASRTKDFSIIMKAQTLHHPRPFISRAYPPATIPHAGLQSFFAHCVPKSPGNFWFLWARCLSPTSCSVYLLTRGRQMIPWKSNYFTIRHLDIKHILDSRMSAVQTFPSTFIL